MLLSSAATARALGVKPQTLYAYVSRGLIAPVERMGAQGSWFDPEEVAAFGAVRGRRGQDPVIESEITLIEHSGHAYRGRPAIRLASSSSYTEVAELLWGSGQPHPDWSGDNDWIEAAKAALELAAPFATAHDRLRLASAAAGVRDPLATDATLMAPTARRLIPSIAAAFGHGPVDEPLTAMVWAAISDRPPTPPELSLVEQIMVLLADHGLAASTLAARAAASYGAGPHAVIGAGLGAFSGARHGAASVRVERLMESALERGAAHAVGEVLSGHGEIPGVGHALYPHGDPRASYLLERLESLDADRELLRPEVMDSVRELYQVIRDRQLSPPNVDFALGAFGLALGLKPGSGEFTFAIARMAGWIGHGIEAAAGPITRPRGRYSGPRPVPD